MPDTTRSPASCSTAPAGGQGPGFYFVAKGAKPENIAAGAARVFLGVRIECAQCHNHPFAKWRREQFWQFAAFFAGIDRPAERPDRRRRTSGRADDSRHRKSRAGQIPRRPARRSERPKSPAGRVGRLDRRPAESLILRGLPSTASGPISSGRESSTRSTTSTNRTRRAIRSFWTRSRPTSRNRNTT